MGLIGTTAGAVAVGKHQQDKKIAVEQANRRMDQADRKMDITEKQLAEKTREFDIKTEEHKADRESKEKLADILHKERDAANTVAALEAGTHNITAKTRAARQEAESNKLNAQAKQIEEQTRGMKQKRLAEKHAWEAAQDAQVTHSNQKMGISSIKQGIKYKGHAMVGSPVEEV